MAYGQDEQTLRFSDAVLTCARRLRCSIVPEPHSFFPRALGTEGWGFSLDLHIRRFRASSRSPTHWPDCCNYTSGLRPDSFHCTQAQ